METSFKTNIPSSQTQNILELSPQESYRVHQDTLRDIVANDHFGGGEEQVPNGIVDQWVAAMEPGSKMPLPNNIRGFYGGSLKASIPIEVARGSYKHIIYETDDKEEVDKYARRMLMALSVLDLDDLVEKEPVLGAAALWHKALAQVRLPDCNNSLGVTLQQYEAVRPKINLTDSKMPQSARLKARLTSVAQELENHATLDTLNMWLPDS
ncbi:hypothetical protein SLS60_003632 [Paraconiothyrium brasiliense]|uniref:Uncharacterized protein n=1 Tax=Paraconiothyrium brasiliense TaxID=300254 RepID=A0ABR3RP60_9PLEO